MLLSNEASGSQAFHQLSPLNVASLLSRARLLQHAALEGRIAPLLRGKNFGVLCETQNSEDLALFRRAAEELGAHVATIRPSLSTANSPQEARHTARVLGRLYDAVECQGIDPALVLQIGQYAGIPVYEGAATQDHPTARLAELLGGAAPLADNRRFMLQAWLLESIN
jgi:ornithine carbamoyltransferase